jgi:hypothetical protein
MGSVMARWLVARNCKTLTEKGHFTSLVRAHTRTIYRRGSTSTHTRYIRVDALMAGGGAGRWPLPLALELEVAPAVARKLSRAVGMVRRSPTFSPPQRAEAKLLVTRHCWALVTSARKEKGGFHPRFILKDAVATSEAPKVETSTSDMDTGKRDEEARIAVKGGDAGGRQLAAKGRGVQHRQGDTLAGTDAGKRVVYVVVGGGRRGPSAGADRPTAGNPLRPGARAGLSGGPAAWGPATALPNEVTLRVLHLAGYGRL